MSALVEILRVEQPEPSRAAWDAWDAAQKRRLGWRSALRRGDTDDLGNPVLLTWHWPHRRFASWRVYPTPPDKGFLRFLGISRANGCLTLALWFCGFIVARADPGARDIPSAFHELSAPAIHDASGDYAGGGRDGATAREWPDHPPAPVRTIHIEDFLRGLFI